MATATQTSATAMPPAGPRHLRARARRDVEVLAEREQRHEHRDAEQIDGLQEPERRDDGESSTRR